MFYWFKSFLLIVVLIFGSWNRAWGCGTIELTIDKKNFEVSAPITGNYSCDRAFSFESRACTAYCLTLGCKMDESSKDQQCSNCGHDGEWLTFSCDIHMKINCVCSPMNKGSKSQL